MLQNIMTSKRVEPLGLYSLKNTLKLLKPKESIRRRIIILFEQFLIQGYPRGLAISPPLSVVIVI